MTRRRQALVTAGAFAGALLVTVATATPALTATDAPPETTVRKSVQTLMDPSGDVQARRVYTQIQSVGNGQVSFTDAANGSLRNLNSFGLPPVSDGTATFDYTVDGLDNQRTLQDYTTDLPISIKVSATLDGQEISPNDVLGKSGLLKMTYVIKNETAVPRPITWTDGTGTQQTKIEQVPLPYVGSFETDLPDSYAQINAPGASIGGTGRNSTLLSYNLIMYKPLGDIEQTITYEARVTDADVPQVDLTFLPSGPAENASTAALQDQIKGGQDAGVQLTDAGTQIDDNLLKLAAGAGTLNAGLAQLYAGAQTLSSGLNDTAVPGAKKLAAGATLVSGGAKVAAKGGAQLADGATQVSDGATAAQAGSKKLATGSAQVAAGATDAASGGKQLATGSSTLAAGTAALVHGVDLLATGISQLPTSVASDPGFVQLKGALAAVQAGIGSKSDSFVPAATTLNAGLNQLEFGLDNPGCDTANPENPANPCGFKQVLQILQSELDNANPATPGAKQALTNILGVLGTTPANPALPLGGFVTATTNLFTLLGCAPTGPTTGSCSGVPDAAQSAMTYATLGFYLQALGSTTTPGNTVLYGLNSIKAKIGDTSTPDTALYAINKLVLGIGTPADFPAPSGSTLYYGLEKIRFGLTNPACSLANPTSTTNPCGIKEVQGLVSAGLDQLVQGIADQLAANVGTAPPAANCDPTKTLTCGAAAVNAGATQVAAGNAQLSSGLTTLSGGAGQVASGNKDLATGLTTLAGGADQVATGSDELATGLATLSGGATQVSGGADQLATGLAPAASGATQISDGLGQAVPGGKQIEDGANQLSAEGTKKLISTGNDTANSYGEQYALMQALNVRSATQQGIPNGPAEGTDVATTGAFGYTLAGVSQADVTNGLRFLLAAVLLAAAVGIGMAFARN